MINIGTLVSAAIRPNNSLDPIASAFASEIKGGLHTASSSTDRDNIILERRDWGMLCYVINQDTTYQLKYSHVDTNIMNNSNWVEFIGGSGGGEWLDSVLSVSLQPPGDFSTGDRYLAGTNPDQTLTGTWATYSAGVVFEWDSIKWVPTFPTDGTSLRVDNDDNSIYRYEGTYPIGEWSKENLSQIRDISINTLNGVDFTSNTEPKFDGYVKDMIFLSKFTSSNTGSAASLNINSLGVVSIKKPTSTGLSDLTPGEIIPGIIYTLVYDGNYFQLIKHYSDSGGLDIKYYIEPNDYITIPPYHQYWVYGDLTIDGELVNYGEVVIGNGSILGSGTFSNFGSLKLVTLAQGTLIGSPSTIYFNDTETIEIVEQQTITGLSVSANVKPNSLLPINLNTSTYSGPTAGYILSSTNDGYFEWIQQSAKITVIDGTPGQGITISDVNNMVFIGGTVKVPVTGGTDSSAGVQVLPGGQSYPAGTALIYIPKAPAPIYASFFNEDKQPSSNTNGLVSRTLDVSNVRISSPTSTNTPFSIGNWNNTPDNAAFPATINDTPLFITIQEVTGFSGTFSGSDSDITVDLLDGDGNTVLYTYTTPVISSNGSFTASNGPDFLINVIITNYEIDDSGFPEIHPPKWKARPQITVNVRNIFNLVSREGGRYQIKITHKLDTPTNYSNDSNPVYISNTVFLDFNPNTPSIEGLTTIQETSPSTITTRFISGVQYYTTGSEFTVDVTDISNLNKNTQGFNLGIDYNFRLKSTGFGLPGGGSGGSSATNGNLNLRAWSPINGVFNGWTNHFDIGTVSYSRTDWSIDSTSYRYRGTGARMESQVYDPWGVSSINLSTTQNILIDCNQTNSSDLVENFNIENKRLIRGISNYSSWNSQTLLSTTSTATDGSLGSPNVPYVDALFVGGELRSPVKYFLTDPNNQVQTNLSGFKPDKSISNPNYTSLTGTAVFHRSFITTNPSAISSLNMTLSGSFGSINNLQNALENSRLKIYVRKVNAATLSHQYGPTSEPLSLHGGLYNSGDFDDGVSGLDNSKGFMRTGVSGNTVSGTFGGFDALDGIWIEVQLVDNTISLTSITVAFVQ